MVLVIIVISIEMVYNGVFYEYKLVSVDYSNGKEEFGPVEAMPSGVPRLFKLGANFPNPFRKTTVIRFELPWESKVSLNIYNIQGRLVRRLITPDKLLTAASHEAVWDGRNKITCPLQAAHIFSPATANKFVKSRVMVKLE